MANIYMQNGRAFAPIDAEQFTNELPLGAYTVVRTMDGLMLERVDDLEVPEQRYGNVDALAERIVRTYRDRTCGTGVLMMGPKGTGKTMTAKLVCKLAGVPVIIVNSDYHGDHFSQLIQSLEQPAAILFEEFEKVYGRYEQQALLTLLDGVYQTHKLFLFTVNDESELDRHLLNRPGRIYYAIRFRGIDSEFVDAYCQRNLARYSERIEGLRAVVSKFREFSFDQLKALVEEMNRYGESAEEAVEMLNIKHEMRDGE